MKTKTKKYISILVAIGAFCLFGAVLVHAVVYSPDTEVSTPSVVVAQNTVPAELIIPAIDVDAKIQTVGVTTTNHIGVPTNFTDVAWYKYSAVPGTKGVAIIDGHVDDGLALPAVFIHLDELKKGDTIDVIRADTTKLVFTVTGSKAYAKDTSTTDLFPDTGKAQLILITCTGNWLSNLHTHDERLLVSAVLTSEK